MENKPTIEEEIVKMLRTVYDPEIPVNIYDLGLIYNIAGGSLPTASARQKRV